MKIFSITRVKNEADVIESFCRHGCSFCDGMLICDNHSQDETVDIIKKLVGESLPVHLIENMPDVSVGDLALHRLLDQAMKDFGADLVLPLDADEFPFNPDGRNPREALERLDGPFEYQVKWRSYIFTQTLDDNQTFLPEFFHLFRSPEAEPYGKVIISRQVYESRNCRIGPGKHSLSYSDQGVEAPKITDVDDLLYAHYPLRGKYQAIRKAIIGELAHQMKENRLPNEAHQYSRIVGHLTASGDLSLEQLNDFSRQYGLLGPEEAQCVSVAEGRNYPGAGGAPRLKYTDYSSPQKYFWKCLLAFLEYKNKRT